MKQIQVCTLAAAALALLACGKTPNTPVEPGKDINSVEIENESVPVPIELGSGTATKAAMIDAAAFADTKFGVLAIDVNAAATDANKVLLNGVEAGNTTPAGKAYSITNFTEGPYYYPLISKNNYTFFGYRTNEVRNYTLSEGYIVPDIDLGYSDIIWAKAEATTLPELTGFEQYAGYNGFNAKYIRAIKAIAGAGDYLAGTYAPKLHFNHITSALSFNIKAADGAAEESLDGKATLTGITLKNVKTTANLAVLTGVLSTEAEAADLVVKTAAGETPTAAAFLEAGAVFGAPLFILPSAIDNPYANNGDGYSVVLSLLVNGEAMTLDPIALTLPAGGFEAGKAYKFTIAINSLEEIEIVTELEPWVNVVIDTPIVIE